MDLQQLAEVVDPEGLIIKRVSTESELRAFADVLTLGFGEGESEARWTTDMYRRIGLGDDVPWRHYVAWLGSAPVATASLFFAAGVAGIYFVSTAPEFRRRGIGTAITHAALSEARDLSMRVAVLGSSPMGQSIYERLGFRVYCTIKICEWTPRSHS